MTYPRVSFSSAFSVPQPMLDPTTGTFTFEKPPTTIAPSLTRDEFLASPLFSGATTHIENEPYHSWALAGTFRSFGLDLHVVLFFHHQRLTLVQLENSDPRFDISREKQLACKASHDAWLSRSLHSKRNFSWGRVWSGYDDAKSGFSSIDVHYTPDP